jgi:hypothetical protein
MVRQRADTADLTMTLTTTPHSFFARFGFGETPAEGWEAVTRAAEAGAWGAVWDRFDADSQNRLAPAVLGYARTPDPKSADAMADRERYKFVMQRRPQSQEQFSPLPFSTCSGPEIAPRSR